jgi:chromosome segregation ATPase
MNDIVERLRGYENPELREAADEIERLEKVIALMIPERNRDINEIERLRNTIKNCPPVSESEYVRRLEDEIERLREEVRVGAELIAEANGEIERINAARHADSQRMVRMSDEYEAAQNEIERLREALKIIAGRQQCLDNLMSNVDVACAALDGGKP